MNHVGHGVGQVHAKEIVIQVDEAVKLPLEAGPILMDELGQVNLLVGGGLAGGGGLIAHGLGQGADAVNGLGGHGHKVPQGHADDVIQRNQNGEGQEGPEAAAHGVDALPGVQVGHFLVLLLLIVGVAHLDVLDFALHAVHPQHALLALELEGQNHDFHHQGEQNQRQTVGAGDAVKQARQPCEGNTDIVSELCEHNGIPPCFF